MNKMEFNSEQKFREFMNMPLDLNKRKNYPYSDEMVIRKAKIYEVLGPKNDKLKVQIMPEFYGIDEEEMKNLPEYPMFFQGEMITGLSQKKDGDAAEYVWVICTSDFQVGYILGKANNFGDSTKKYEASYGYGKVKEFLAARQAVPEDFDYAHLQVVNWTQSGNGGFIQCFNYVTGDYVLLNTSGTIFTLQQKRIFLRVGTPSSSGNVAHSKLEMTPDKIYLKAPNVEIDAQDLVLGKHNLQLVGTLASAPIIGKLGNSCQGVSNIHV